MPVCQSCPGRDFRSEGALSQHQAAKHSNPALDPASDIKILGSTQKAQVGPSKARRHRENRMRGGLHEEPIHTINAAELQPSVAPVSSTDSHELVCSYNWRKSKGFHVPGHAPYWQDLSLPQVLPKDKNFKGLPKMLSGWEKTKYPFEQVFQAIRLMNPSFRFREVDIMVTRNSLRKLLDFCSNRSQDSFRINLSLVRNTLLIEQHDTAFMSSQNVGWGHSFERAFTQFPSGLEDSTSHDRFLRYPIGDLTCIVGFEVDACYQPNGQSEAIDTAGLEHLTLQESSPVDPGVNSKAPAQSSNAMSQSTAAELKSSKGPKSLSSVLPQLWFGRTPWLITGSHTEGTFHTISITDAGAHFGRWETERQVELRKLAAVLADLRDAIRKYDEKSCAAIYEKGAGSRVIKVCGLQKEKAAVPGKIVGQFWG